MASRVQPLAIARGRAPWTVARAQEARAPLTFQTAPLATVLPLRSLQLAMHQMGFKRPEQLHTVAACQDPSRQGLGLPPPLA